MKATSKATLIALLLPLCVFAQRKAPPFRIDLPHGYHLRQLRGVDTRTGEISKLGGLFIRYDMGGDLPTADESKIKPAQQWNRQCSWKKDGSPDPIADAADVLCWIDVDEDKHEKILYVWFPDLTEFWTKVKDQHQIDLALKILLTYSPDI